MTIDQCEQETALVPLSILDDRELAVVQSSQVLEEQDRLLVQVKTWLKALWRVRRRSTLPSLNIVSPFHAIANKAWPFSFTHQSDQTHHQQHNDLFSQGENATKISFCRSMIRWVWRYAATRYCPSSSISIVHLSRDPVWCSRWVAVCVFCQMHAMTTVALSSTFQEDRLWLNGAEERVASNPRLVNCLREVRRQATKNQVSSKQRRCGGQESQSVAFFVEKLKRFRTWRRTSVLKTTFPRPPDWPLRQPDMRA